MWSWRVGSIRGIALKIHATFPLVLLWAAVQSGAGRVEGLPFALYGAGLVLLLFGCVLLHELGHALVALHYGVPVTEIVLLPIGGLAKLRVLRDDPKQEFLIALAGPLVNFAIALLLIPVVAWMVSQFHSDLLAPLDGSSESQARAIALLLARTTYGLSVEGAVVYLLFANVMLALFNLIPAFPMDGGRLLRAVLALFLPYRWATTIAVRLGQLLAALLALWGFRANPGLLLLALFVFISGGAELQRVALREVLARGQVESYMIRGLQPLVPQWSLYAARLLAQQTGQRAFPVIENGTLLGLLTVRELHAHAPSSTVGEAMVAQFPVLAPARTLYDAQLALLGQDQFAAAVMEGGVLLGLLSLEDIERGYHSLRRQPTVRTA